MLSDRLIKVFVGPPRKGQRPYLVQQTLLASASDYFAKAIKHENMGVNSEPGVLRFPDDDSGAWKVFLHWLMWRELPSETITDRLAVHCWILGDCYHITRFQDDAMFELLECFEDDGAEEELIMVAFQQTPPGSKLRALMSEELAYLMQEELTPFDKVDPLLNGSNFAGELLGALARLRSSGDRTIIYRFRRTDDGQYPWKEFMVGDGAIRLEGYARELRHK
ncbi:hypothetical protein B0A50_00431 [Salinomyces thailandicus]|uniref:BTB domain-containing protein n=1 Tax=Salinomyces thailandicus TaxID=706561 RepID=A0A4U0UGJ8_9PEZI|nr:hypothetical protein B0A50_00431 [Salinomyces thailandica]